MKTSIVLFTLLLSVQAFSQNSNVTFFAENGERFFVILNGMRYNDQPQTNVVVENLSPQAYKAKIIFEDAALGEANRTVYLEPNMAYTVNIRKRKEGAAAMGDFARQTKNEVKNALDDDDEMQDYTNPAELYVMRLVGQTPLQNYTQAPPPPAPTPTPTNRATAYPSASSSQMTTTTTTTTTVSDPMMQPGVNMNISVSGTGGGGSVSMHATDSYYQESTSTTVTTTTNTPPAPDHYVMAGYNGPYGCPWPMAPQDFSSAKSTISSKTWDDTRLSIAKQVTQSNCLFADQVREIVMLMEWEETKLDYAKFAYRYTYDQANYFKVHDAFEWESSIEDLNRAIGH